MVCCQQLLFRIAASLGRTRARLTGAAYDKDKKQAIESRPATLA